MAPQTTRTSSMLSAGLENSKNKLKNPGRIAQKSRFSRMFRPQKDIQDISRVQGFPGSVDTLRLFMVNHPGTSFCVLIPGINACRPLGREKHGFPGIALPFPIGFSQKARNGQNIEYYSFPFSMCLILLENPKEYSGSLLKTHVWVDFPPGLPSIQFSIRKRHANGRKNSENLYEVGFV